MADLDVRAAGEGLYEADVVAADGQGSRHLIEADAAALDRLHATAADEPFVVRRALELVLRRSDGVGLAERATLTELDAAYPGVLSELDDLGWR